MDKMGRGEDLVKISDITYDYRSIFTFYLAMIFFDFVVNKVYLVVFVPMYEFPETFRREAILFF